MISCIPLRGGGGGGGHSSFMDGGPSDILGLNSFGESAISCI